MNLLRIINNNQRFINRKVDISTDLSTNQQVFFIKKFVFLLYIIYIQNFPQPENTRSFVLWISTGVDNFVDNFFHMFIKFVYNLLITYGLFPVNSQ